MGPFFLLGFIACGTKSTDTASSTDTGSTSEPSSAQPSSEPSGQPSSEPSSQPSSEPSSQPSSEPSSQDTGDMDHQDDTGNNEENNSEPPPTGSCTENSVVANIEAAYETEQFFPSFYWDMSSDDNGLVVVFAGFKASSDVDVCSTLSTNQPPEFPQVVVMARPTLSELPQELAVGLWGISENASAQGFMGDPALDRKFWVTEGSLTVNSIIEGESSYISTLQLAELGEEAIDGDWSSIETVPGYVQSGAEGSGVISCYCDGLADFYLAMMEGN